MEKLEDIGRILKHIYYLDEKDYIYVSCGLTRTFDWTIPSIAGGWMFKRIYLIKNKNTKTYKYLVRFFPLICPAFSLCTMYSIYYRNNPRLKEIINKYPSTTNFYQRPKINPFKVGKNN
jgi:hypothetical protein